MNGIYAKLHHVVLTSIIQPPPKSPSGTWWNTCFTHPFQWVIIFLYNVRAPYYKIMLNIKQLDCLSNKRIYHMANTQPLMNSVRQRLLCILGHILRYLKKSHAENMSCKFRLMARQKKTSVAEKPRTSYLSVPKRNRLKKESLKSTFCDKTIRHASK